MHAPDAAAAREALAAAGFACESGAAGELLAVEGLTPVEAFRAAEVARGALGLGALVAAGFAAAWLLL